MYCINYWVYNDVDWIKKLIEYVQVGYVNCNLFMILIVLIRVYDLRISSVYKCVLSKNIILKILFLLGLKMKFKI